LTPELWVQILAKLPIAWGKLFILSLDFLLCKMAIKHIYKGVEILIKYLVGSKQYMEIKLARRL
jgi:hypothetical protein